MSAQLHPDEAVIENFRNGDALAFKSVFNHYYPSVYYLSYKMIHDRAQAEDIALYCFEKLFQRAANFESGPNIKSFLLISARNQSLNYLKSSKRQEAIKKEFIVVSESQIEAENKFAIMDDMVELVRSAVNELPNECRKIFEMLIYQELSPADVSEILNISISTVRNQKLRALQALRAKLKNRSPLLPLLLALTKSMQGVMSD